MIFSLRMRWHMPAARNIMRYAALACRRTNACLQCARTRHMQSTWLYTVQLAAQLARRETAVLQQMS